MSVIYAARFALPALAICHCRCTSSIDIHVLV
jgi:hypothetical protein